MESGGNRMKIFTKTILAMLTLGILAQPSNALGMQKMKDFLSYSATKIMQSIYNNKQAYAFGAVAIGAVAVGLGWYYASKIAKKDTSSKTKPTEPVTSPSSTIRIETIKPNIAPIKNDLVNEFDTILKNLAEIKVDNSLLKEFDAVRKILLEQPSHLDAALKTLESIREKNNEIMFFPDIGEVSGKYLFAVYLEEFIKKLKSQIQALQPHIAGRPYGLVNNNNSCFMNAAIQCLHSLEKCNEVLVSTKCYKKDSLSESYLQLLDAMQKGSLAVINPSQFCQSGWKLFNEGSLTQQDSPEFVQRLVQALIEEDVIKEAMPQGKNNKILDLLKITVSENLCSSTGEVIFKESEHTSPILPPITVSGNHKTLSDCLRSFFTNESDPLQKKAMILEGVSNYFIIRLIRDAYNKETKQQSKIEQPISFELKNFKIDELSSGSNKFPLYQCKALILHAGNAGSGHYIAFVKKNSSWFLCDDTTIIPVSNAVIDDIARQGIFIQEGCQGKKIFTPVMFFYEQQS